MVYLKFNPNYIIWVSIFVFILISIVSTNKSTTNSYYFRNHVTCSCLMNEMDDFEVLACPTPNKLGILYGYLFDAGEFVEKENCTSNKENVKVIKIITSDLQSICSTGSYCQITKSFLINSKGDYSKIDCLSASIVWTCNPNSNQNNSSNSHYNFTYFFYIITLIFSSSCILIGSLFILRRFIILRRRNNQMMSRTRQNNCYATRGSNQAYHNHIWSTSSFGPPAYENIYDSSLPVVNSIPPPYEIVKNKKDVNFETNVPCESTNQERDVIEQVINNDETRNEETRVNNDQTNGEDNVKRDSQLENVNVSNDENKYENISI